MNIPLAHTMGGEVSGTIDESISMQSQNLPIYISLHVKEPEKE